VLPDLFFIQNFSPSEAVRGAFLPDGGAGIKVLIPSQAVHVKGHSPTNIEDWAALDAAHQTILSKRDVQITDGKRSLPAIELLLTDCCGGSAPYEESINWYFQIDGHIFLATLFYWQGDPHASELRNTLKGIVLSLKVTKAHRNTK
jgi:hypothetical protein